MKIVQEESLISAGAFPASVEWSAIRTQLHAAIRNVEWPAGSGSFTIYPVKKANGVTPIKTGLLKELQDYGWKPEQSLAIPTSATESTPGPLDAAIRTTAGDVVLEWETGNISSSHRALNKMALGLLQKWLVAGILVVPSAKLYPYLTDRVGNIAELMSYLPLWKSIPVAEGVLEIVVIEQDGESMGAPKIPKGTDGRALR